MKKFILIAKNTIFLPLLTHKSKCSLTHTSWLIFRWIYSLAIIRKQRFMNSDERKSRTFSMLCQCKCFNYQPLLFNQTWDRCPINVEPIEYLKWPQRFLFRSAIKITRISIHKMDNKTSTISQTSIFDVVIRYNRDKRAISIQINARCVRCAYVRFVGYFRSRGMVFYIAVCHCPMAIIKCT